MTNIQNIISRIEHGSLSGDKNILDALEWYNLQEKDGVSGRDAFGFAFCAFVFGVLIGIGIMLIKI